MSRDNVFTRMSEVECARALDYNDDEFVARCLQYRKPAERARIQYLCEVNSHARYAQLDTSKMSAARRSEHKRGVQISKDVLKSAKFETRAGMTFEEALKIMGLDPSLA